MVSNGSRNCKLAMMSWGMRAIALNCPGCYCSFQHVGFLLSDYSVLMVSSGSSNHEFNESGRTVDGSVD